MKIDKVVVLAILLCVVVFVGEYFTYYTDPENREIDATWGTGSVTYTLKSTGSDWYTVMIFDNGGFDHTEKLYIYSDSHYDDTYSEAYTLSGDYAYPESINQNDFSEQLILSLKIRGFTNVETIDDAGILDLLKSTLSSPSGIGLFIPSYALPSTVYSGNSDDLILQWVNNGGNLYWAGSEIGKYYRDSEGIHVVENNQSLFFGKENVVNTAHQKSTEYVSSVQVDNGFLKALSLRNGNTRFGLNIDGLEGIQAGFTQDGYATISLVSVGKGMVCVFGGQGNIENRDDMCQIIASGLTCKSSFESVSNGDVTRRTVQDTRPFSNTDPYVYIYFGGIFVTCGKVMHYE